MNSYVIPPQKWEERSQRASRIEGGIWFISENPTSPTKLFRESTKKFRACPYFEARALVKSEK
jgi:hypothetical protein